MASARLSSGDLAANASAVREGEGWWGPLAREKGRRGGRKVVGPTGAKSSFHTAVNGSRMENLTECRIMNES